MNENFARLPSTLRPIKTPLIRLGSDSDGGYVVPRMAIDRATHLLAFGLETNWSFEDDFASCRQSEPTFSGVDAYDPTLTSWLLAKRTVRHIGRKFRGKRIDDMGTWSSYRRLFGRADVTHYKQWIGQGYGANTIDLNCCMLRVPANAQVFLKMDIEGAEYQVLNQIADVSQRLTGIVVELHSFDTARHDFAKQLNTISRDFYVAHVHVNNWCQFDDRRCPSVIEVSYLSRRFVQAAEFSDAALPLKNLDCPNNRSQPDIAIVFDEPNSWPAVA